MAVSESQLRASKKYHSKFERICIRVSAEEKESIEAFAEKAGESVNSFIRRVVANAIANSSDKSMSALDKHNE